jgi:hypothetical protein
MVFLGVDQSGVQAVGSGSVGSGACLGNDAPPPAFGEHGDHVDSLRNLLLIRRFDVDHHDFRLLAIRPATISAPTVVLATIIQLLAGCFVDAFLARTRGFFDIGCPFDPVVKFVDDAVCMQRSPVLQRRSSFDRITFGYSGWGRRFLVADNNDSPAAVATNLPRLRRRPGREER